MADDPEKPKIVFHGMMADPELTIVLKESINLATQDGTDGNKICMAISDLIDKQTVMATMGAILLSLMATAKKVSEDTKVSEVTVMTSICTALLSLTTKMEERKKFSPN